MWFMFHTCDMCKQQKSLLLLFSYKGHLKNTVIALIMIHGNLQDSGRAQRLWRMLGSYRALTMTWNINGRGRGEELWWEVPKPA